MSKVELCETVRIRDKSMEGGSRIINKADLQASDLIIDGDVSDENKGDKPGKNPTTGKSGDKGDADKNP